jgi:hypothetical protein
MIPVSVISLFVNNEVGMKFRKFIFFINIGKVTSDIKVPQITQLVKQKHVVTSTKSLLSDLTFGRVYLKLLNLVL